MKKVILYLAFALGCTLNATGQGGMRYFITVNGNMYLPFSSEKQTYPILAYDKDADPKVLAGGFGIGFTAMNEWKEKWLLKGQANLSRHAYWDDPIEFKDANNNPLGFYIGKSVDYVAGLTATVQYRLGSKVALGTGLGADVLLTSVYKLSDPFTQEEKFQNENYKTFTPVLPVELSFYLNKVLINLRYEQGLVNRYKEAFADFKEERNGLLVFEFGYRLR